MNPARLLALVALAISSLTGCKTLDGITDGISGLSDFGGPSINPSITLPNPEELRDKVAIVIVDDKTRHAPHLVTPGKVKFETALQEAGMRVNDHAAASQLDALLDQIKVHQDPQRLAAELDQLGVDIVFLVEINDYEVSHRGNAGQSTKRYSLTMNVTLRGVDPTSAKRDVSGEVVVSGNVSDEADAKKSANNALDKFADELAKALAPKEPTPAGKS